jgi:hypothetical protein
VSDAVQKVRDAHESGFQPIASDVETLLAEVDRLRNVETAVRSLLGEYPHLVGGAYALNNRRIAALERLRDLLDQNDDKEPA